jgi:hypothetical protein
MTPATVSDIRPSLQATDNHDVERALDQAATAMANPAYGNRLRLAKELVQRGAVTLHDDGTATVVSGDHTYDINQACTCEDSRLRSPYCKHVLAAQLKSRLTRQLGPAQNGCGWPEGAGATPTPATSQTWAVNEAAASCCLKFKIDGIDVMYTMRDVSDGALFPRVKQMLARLHDKIGPTEAQAASPTTEHKPTEREGWCPIHQCQMTRNTNERGSWWSHLTAEGFCKGK